MFVFGRIRSFCVLYIYFPIYKKKNAHTIVIAFVSCISRCKAETVSFPELIFTTKPKSKTNRKGVPGCCVVTEVM